jgi:hypothetical protein
VKFGSGRHFENIPVNNIPSALYFWWLCELLYTVTTVFIRLSIAVFLLRITATPLHRFFIYATLAVVLAFSTFYLFLVIFQCTPVNFFWNQAKLGDPSIAGGYCVARDVVPNASIAHSVISFLADWILGLLPILLLWEVQMNSRTKISISVILSMGLL